MDYYMYSIEVSLKIISSFKLNYYCVSLKTESVSQYLSSWKHFPQILKSLSTINEHITITITCVPQHWDCTCITNTITGMSITVTITITSVF